MSPTAAAVRAGWRRGRIELRQSLSNPADLINHALWPTLMLLTVIFLPDISLGSGLLLATSVVPGILGMNVALGMVSISQQLTADREDGTLLRAKATPNGMLGYLLGKVIAVSAGLVVDLAIFLIPAMLIVRGLAVGTLQSWLAVLGTLAIGLVATLPIGAILGSVFTSTRAQGLVTLPVLALIGISGIFYPVTALPEWLQVLAQLFPFYWLGLEMRAALLPDHAVVVEIGESWRQLQGLGVLGAWAVAGLLLAPILLRRMARRESGSTVERRKDRALRRVG